MQRALIRMTTVLLLATAFAAYAHDVVIERNVNLWVGPSTQTEVIKLLKTGDQARLLNLEKQNNYYRVLHNAGVGWVWSNKVKVITEYLRKQWRHWSDADGDCQDTRQEVLIEESEIAVTFTNADECRVLAGRWTDPYSGDIFTDPRKLDVDHMVPLRNAQRSGGWEWTKQRREEYANDLDNPEHLIAVDKSLNRSKSDKGPDKWLPPNENYHCQYVSDWEAIKHDYLISKSKTTTTACCITRASDGSGPTM